MSIVGLGTNSKENENVYDQWAGAYAEDVTSWGYHLPESAAKLVFQYSTTNSSDNKRLTILDAGAGDGLTGVALRQVGFVDAEITGADISQEMLKKANERKCYNQTQVLDLNQPLETIPSDSLDIVHCIGTLTYVAPDAGALQEFIRITKPGGLVCYSNRTDKLDLWKDVEASLSEKWNLVEKVGPISYLPGNPEYADKVQVVIFLYRVT
mmetsp:Transcript_12677/g.25673  ORF Transcript_12677/g.25673 Transcript_12677/m.25673 type:complete len:210 (-) Transcript_12677:171-800(-)